LLTSFHGDAVAEADGEAVGDAVGDAVGEAVGDAVGDAVVSGGMVSGVVAGWVLGFGPAGPVGVSKNGDSSADRTTATATAATVHTGARTIARGTRSPSDTLPRSM
jgi:hypothetical protein